MFTVDLLVGYKNKLFADHLCDQYKQNEKNICKSNLYTKLNNNLINIISNYSSSNIFIAYSIINKQLISERKYNKIILCVNDLIEITPYIVKTYAINNIYIEQFSITRSSLYVRNIGKENECYINGSLVDYNIKGLNKFGIDFKKHKDIKIYKFDDIIFYHFIYDQNIGKYI